MSVRTWLTAALVALLLGGLGGLGGCTGGAEDASSGTDPSTSTEKSTRSVAPHADAPVPVPEAPDMGACYRLGFGQLTKVANDNKTVRCRGRHNAQTIHVGTLDTVVDGHKVAVDSDHVRRQLARTCPRRMARYLGGTVETRRLSRFQAIWFSPTPEQADRGADWFRCDVIALAGPERLADLPRRTRLRGVLDRDDALATYGLCGTAAPGAKGFTRVICGGRHRWKAISTIPIPGGKKYPGEAKARRSGDEACKDEASGRADDPLQFQYGWEWPTGSQWESGQHYGYCWVPD